MCSAQDKPVTNEKANEITNGILQDRYSHAFFISLSLEMGLLCAKHTLLAKQAYFPQGGNLRPLPIYDLRYANPMKTAVRLGPISPITG